MSETRYCLNCNNIQPMNVHGRCPCCDSDSVVLAESIGPFRQIQDESLQEIERMYALPSKA